MNFVRNYWSIAKPGEFFRPMGLLLLISGGTSFVTTWLRDHKRKRNLILLSLMLVMASQFLTVYYFVPQNNLLRYGTNQRVIEQELMVKSTREFDIF
jgi:hypothetical protein